MTRPSRKMHKVSAAKHIPAFVTPCLARLDSVPPAGDAWGHEVKFDGYRLEALCGGGEVRLVTRNGLDWTLRFGALQVAFAGLRVQSATIDGEAIVEDENGISRFSALQKELKSGLSTRIAFVAFDLLHLDGMDTRRLPLADRKALLRTLLGGATKGPLRYSEHIIGDGRPVLKNACRLGLEGIISKRLDLPYRSGRHGDWIKTKCKFEDEFVIGGFTPSRAARASIGALVLGYYEGKRFCYCGRVGTGFDHEAARELWATLQKLRCAKPPFADTLSRAEAKDVVWARPKLVAQVAYRGWTGDARLRHASFKGLREDKSADEVRRPKTYGPQAL